MRIRSLMALAVPAALFAAASPGCSTEEPSDTSDPTAEADYTSSGLCNGLPKLNLKTPAGMCVGIVAEGITFARGMTQLPNGDVIVASMGGWALNKGSIWRIRKGADGKYTKTQVQTLIDKPSGVQFNKKDGLVYVGTPSDIFRMDPNLTPRPKLQQVLRTANPNGARHPLKQFVFDANNPDILYVNIGSASDNGETNGVYERNPLDEQQDRGAIRKYVLEGPERLAKTADPTSPHCKNPAPAAGQKCPSEYTVFARGLRNSMALVMHPSGTLLQGENSRDSINKRAPELSSREGELPQEELNVVTEGTHYGWPFCYGNNVPSPEYRTWDCSGYKTPALLLPGHSSPLGARYYDGALFPSVYKGSIIVALHGYRENGHRVVMVPADARGVPAGEPMDIIRGWEKTATNPLGAPVDVMVAQDGSIWVTEDKNGTVLRIFYDKTAGNGLPLKTLPPVHPVVDPAEASRCQALNGRNSAFADVQKNVIDPYCVSCHGAGPGYAGGLALLKCDDVGNYKRLLAPRRNGAPAYVIPRNTNGSEFLQRIKGNGYPQMPAGGVSPEGVHEIESWINAGAPQP